ncbi:MAG: rhodanese-related sulfurtransferase [Acidobacteria bacterium]|nr:rhodanese-related sulfurtransferase [Acidobacteriota bacterium]
MAFTIAAFYRFVDLPDPAALRDELRSHFTEANLCGSMLIAPEGINGTMAGSIETIDSLLNLLHQKTGLPIADVKFSRSEQRPFGRLKFLVKAEIIAFRNATVDPAQAGHYIAPEDWNHVIADPDVLLLDTRNHYETELGTFNGAIDPGIETFSDFVTYVREHLDPEKHRKVAMFCTGGIRCEKASAFMRQEGFPEVYHLKGGILKYLEDIPAEDSKWNGTCFVFDRRTSVSHTDFKK